MDKNVEFIYMHRDIPCTEVKISNGIVSFKNLNKDVTRCAFGVRTTATMGDVQRLFENRCFPKSRGNTKEILKTMGLDYYDAYEICKITHGVLFDDFHWMKFDGEYIKWKDVGIR